MSQPTRIPRKSNQPRERAYLEDPEPLYKPNSDVAPPVSGKVVRYREDSGSEESIKSDEEYSENDASETIEYEEPEVESKLIKIAGKLYIGFFSGDVLLSKTEVKSVRAEEEPPKLGKIQVNEPVKEEVKK